MTYITFKKEQVMSILKVYNTWGLVTISRLQKLKNIQKVDFSNFAVYATLTQAQGPRIRASLSNLYIFRLSSLSSFRK